MLEELLAAIKENTAALKAAGGAPVAEKAPAKAPAKAPPKATAKAAAKSKFTADQVRDRLIEVKEQVGEDEAKEIISNAGYEKLAALIADTSKFDEVMEACEALLGGGDDGGL